MREILFRGKTEKGEWVQGDLLHPDIYGNGYSIEDFTKEKNNCFDVIPETVGQYTGLTDNNGKKIFEGDIVDIQYPDTFVCNTVISYIGASFCGDDGIDAWELDDYTFLEVIGNIHDNPELLKGGEE